MSSFEKRVIKKFFKTRHLCKPLSVHESEIEYVMKKLGKDLEAFKKHDSFLQYIKFLSNFGATSGFNFEICGPIKLMMTRQERLLNIENDQDQFDSINRIRDISEEQIKSYWIIARNDNIDEFYIDVSEEGKGHIYCLYPYDKTTLYAEDFIKFLDNINKLYDKKDKYEEKSFRKLKFW